MSSWIFINLLEYNCVISSIITYVLYIYLYVWNPYFNNSSSIYTSNSPNILITSTCSDNIWICGSRKSILTSPSRYNRIDEEYVWLELANRERFAKLPEGVGSAWNDPEVRAAELEPSANRPYDEFTRMFVINKTMEPGTNLNMYVGFDNNKNLTRCEYEAIAKATSVMSF